MKVKATYFKNDPNKPLRYGDVEISSDSKVKLRGLEPKDEILVYPVITGFCGTDRAFLDMSKAGIMQDKFPQGTDRLVNGHEGVVYVPSQKRFAVVLIRGGESYDPTRYADDETYFEYGCDQADGIMADAGYFHPDMLLEIPDGHVKDDKINLDIAKRLTFADPYACMLFQLERMEDLGEAHNFRVEMAKGNLSESQARAKAKQNVFDRTVIFGMGTTGMLLGHAIKTKYPDSKVLFVGRSPLSEEKQGFLQDINAEYALNDANDLKGSAEKLADVLGGKATSFAGCSGNIVESQLALDYELLSNNGIYNSFSLGPRIEFDSMKFGFNNYLVLSSINFRESHMKAAIKFLCTSDFDKFVSLLPLEDLAKNPEKFYLETAYSTNSAIKTAVSFNPKYLDMK